ncbi:helix-turn-helix domain-containing protein [Roseiconus lacunae]|uniref:helix-turn-helix domain-containing protein n=1 Tax=Roseiconus lacunae TaxID=2605694 RepID=UPI001E4A358D|nr:helix-turn-helix domain-containing protein [Roseiconus lacunae]MCD0459968.1 helix-turn-helix domain-containing protein [Roseiconus lacunae]WRQ50539.1 helix-turn-helix domain-containing protein [Stieleria sp. HD01]
MKSYSTTEAAEILGCSDEMIRQEIKAGRLAAYTIGSGKQRKRYRITDTAIEDYISANTVVIEPRGRRKQRNNTPPKRRWV